MYELKRDPFRLKPFYFHIGAEKCASSLIEVAFLQVENILQHFRNKGIHADFEFHRDLRHSSLFDHWDSEIHGRICSVHLHPHLENETQSIFASEEALLGLSHAEGEENKTATRAELLATLADGFDVRPIIVLRRQDTFIESLYNQLIKRGEKQEFQSWFDSLPLENYEWDRVVDMVAQSFGTNKITVLPYERSLYETRPDGPQNLLHAIACAIGFPELAIDMSSFPIVNPSLPLDLLPAQREINETLEPSVAGQVADILARNKPKSPDQRLGLLDDGTRSALLERYSESNRRLFDEYLSAFPRDSYNE